MKVHIVTNFYPIPAVPARGIWVRRQAQALKRGGHEVTIIQPLPHVVPGARLLVRRAAEFVGQPHRYTDDGIDVCQPRYFTYPGHLRVGMPDLFQYRPVLRLGLDRPDILHAHFAAPAGLLSRRLSAHWKVPYVVTLHGYDTNFWPYHNGFNRRRFRAVCRAAGRVLAVSDHLAAKAQALSGVEPEVVGMGIDMPSPDSLPERADVRKRLGLSPDAFVVLYVGNLIPKKGMEELHALASSRRDLSFVIVGGGPWRDRLGALENVTTLGPVPSEGVPELMRAGDALCLPSHSEGMPNVVLEAGAYGLPVVATRVGGIPEVLGDNERGLMVPVGDANALGAAIDSVRTNPDAARARASALREVIHSRFNTDVFAERLSSIYGEVLNDATTRTSLGKG